MEIYIAKISDIMGEFGLKEMSGMMPGFRLEMAAKYRNQADRERSLAAGMLLGFCMRKKGVSMEETPCFNKNGKMYFLQLDKFYVNLSHSGDYAACVLDDKEAGIDLEKLRQYRDNVAGRICSVTEIQSLFEGKKEEEKNREFTKLWTIKESRVKLLGESVTVLMKNSLPDVELFGNCIHTQTYTPVRDYFLSVSSHENCFPEEVIVLSAKFLGQ